MVRHDSSQIVTSPIFSPAVHYRMYSQDGAIESKHTFQEDDPYIGRIVATRIIPPHTAKFIKRFLCNEENIQDADNADLFATATSEFMLDDQDHVPILVRHGPAASADDPMVIVIKRPPNSPSAAENSSASSTAGRQYTILSEPSRSLSTPTHTGVVYCVAI